MHPNPLRLFRATPAGYADQPWRGRWKIWSLLGNAHLEHLPGIRWKLHHLAQLQNTDAMTFAEQAVVLAIKLA